MLERETVVHEISKSSMNLQDRIIELIKDYRDGGGLPTLDETAKAILALVEENKWRTGVAAILGATPLTASERYYRRDHTHCWNQTSSPCGIPLDKHTQCCLCDTPYPTVSEQCCNFCGWYKLNSDGTPKYSHCANKLCPSCHSLSTGVMKELAEEPTAPVGGWEEEYENQRAHFLTYDKASGSRWLDDDKLKGFIRQTIKNREREIAEGVEGMKVIPHEPDKMYKNGCLLCEKQAVWNNALDDVIALINKPNT
jgi:hypothetical protein